MSDEREQRDLFNQKYRPYLPQAIINNDLERVPVQILYCQNEIRLAKNFLFHDQIEIKKQEILAEVKKISTRIFKDVPNIHQELFYHLD